MAKTKMRGKPKARKAFTRPRKGINTGTSKMVVPRHNIIPDKTIVRMPYCDIQTIPRLLNFSTYGQKSYNINSIYDPESFSLNTSTLGFGDWQFFYQKYRVFACDYEVSLYNSLDNTAVSGSLYIAEYGSGSTGITAGDPSSWLCQPRGRKFFLGNASGGKSSITLKGRVSMPGVLGMTSEQYRTNEDTSSVWNNSPQKLVSMFINLVNTNVNLNQSQVQASVKLTYHVEMFDRLPIPLVANAISTRLDVGIPPLALVQ